MAIKAWIPSPKMVDDGITMLMHRRFFISVDVHQSRGRSVIAPEKERGHQSLVTTVTRAPEQACGAKVVSLR